MGNGIRSARALPLLFFCIPLSISLSEIAGGLVLLLVAYEMRHGAGPAITVPRLTGMGIASLLIMVASGVIMSRNRGLSAPYALGYWKLLIPAGVYLTVARAPDCFRPSLGWFMVGIGLCVMVIAWGSFSKLMPADFVSGYGFLRKNAAGVIYLFSGFWALAMVPPRRAIELLIFLVAAILLVCLDIRESVIGLIVGVMMYYIISGKKMMVSLVTIVTAFIIMYSNTGEYVIRGDGGGMTGNVLDRFAAWSRCIAYWFESPVFGLGLNIFDRIDHDFLWTLNGYTKTGRITPHSMYLKVLVDGGIVGGVLFMVFLGCLFKEITRLRGWRQPGSYSHRILTLMISSFIGFMAVGVFNECFTDAEVFILVFSFYAAVVAYALHAPDNSQLANPAGPGANPVVPGAKEI